MFFCFDTHRQAAATCRAKRFLFARAPSCCRYHNTRFTHTNQSKACLDYCKTVTQGYSPGSVKVSISLKYRCIITVITLLPHITTHPNLSPPHHHHHLTLKSFKSKAWLSGSAFCALLHGTDPDLLDYDAMHGPEAHVWGHIRRR